VILLSGKKNKSEKKKRSSGNGEDKELKGKIGVVSEEIKEEAEKRDKEENEAEEKKKKEEEEMIKKLQEEIDKLTIKDTVIQIMMSLSSLAYKKMGIPVGINDKFKDKQQAKLAIDCFSALFKVVSEEISEAERENLQSSLSNLQMNFVKAFT
jgi:leucyl-tRNA synthetase